MMNKFKWLQGLLMVLVFTACIGKVTPTIPQPTITGLSKEYATILHQEVTLRPTITSATPPSLQWLSDDGQTLSTAETYTFIPNTIGIYKITLRVTNDGGSVSFPITIKVNAPDDIQVTAGQLITFTLDKAPAEKGLLPVAETKPSDDARFGASILPDGRLGFTALTPGAYRIALKDGDKTNTSFNITVTANEELKSQIIKVFEYHPAPGQTINTIPQYKEGDTHEDMCRKATEGLSNLNSMLRNPTCLGGWGGYIVFGFDHTIPNVKGLMDMKIEGNAFLGAYNKRPNAPLGGNSEPGIIYVAYDANGNGLPDDTWYEIKGSGNFSAKDEPWWGFIHPDGKGDTDRTYEMTYYRPKSEKPELSAKPDDPLNYMTIKEYIKWEDNRGHSGYKFKNIYHDQSYYPLWVKEDKITFRGIRLADNTIDEGHFNPTINAGSVYFVRYAYRRGYVDNHVETDDLSATDLDWAIDNEGNPVHLPGINFVKVVSGVDQESGWIGETSTEIYFGYDLHAIGKTIKTPTLPIWP